ncbi:hypothetical protein [Fusibacter sp. JL216-2]|uniref:hypothetical protein n=1 Tax=Fusibacter sp. JL216-2 TaxID=3071453 RepID=UPI003D34C9D7
MNRLKQLISLLNIFAAFIMVALLFYGDETLFALAYILITMLMIRRTLRVEEESKSRVTLTITYILVLAFKLLFNSNGIFGEGLLGIPQSAAKLIGVLLICVPFIIDHIFTSKRYTQFLFPSIDELASFSFHTFRHNKQAIKSKLQVVQKARKSMSRQNIDEILRDIPRHSSRRYVNNGSLTSEYFYQAYKSLEDPYIYIIISNTGSAASEMISLFTNKEYNHASISFDYELKTIISYNGGEKVYPPGLNAEMVEYFNKKSDASIMVYKLKTTFEQKKRLIDEIKKINDEGSAYNLLGLLLRYSHKPNIMFCSQFVYKMLKIADLHYFEKKETNVKPTDFVELDYRRQLEFAYEIQF